MSPFRFRAAAALDLRRRQEQDAGARLARAEADLRAAEAQAADAEGARRDAQQQLGTLERRGSDVVTLMWHRNWIVRLTNDLAARRQRVDQQTQAVRHAERDWRQARQRRLALERLHDRALRRHRQDQQREELKVIDELARLRFVTADARMEDQ